MAEIVAAAGVPHTPVFPALARQDTPAGQDIAARYAAVATELAEADPEVLVLLTSDHLNSYFLDAWPTFAVVAADSVHGPNDDVPGVPDKELAVAGKAALALHESLIEQDFDPALTRGGTVDHSVVVPLHFLDPIGRPVIPVHVNGMVEPLPRAGRCRRFGAALRNAVRDLPVRRAAVIASGSFSLEVGGPRMDPDRLYGIPDPQWAARTSTYLRDGDLDELVAAATPGQIAHAGTVSGELLSWIAMAEMARDLPVSFVDHRNGEGHAFAAWRCR
ncbi:extradiol ring-cleavage dioxygenase class III protein subunit B [Actinoplanes sp. N902-109]|uniref:DODA-type extradiol aromatic ring-opening family dioxygenase n=1 Tax=Actinoplanes sp. (strain N902-109) TaxID=649831 RepID=UPI00032934A1|nr:extradiol ring-cleavage dioxygenase class III protein subunit B [Actinoplanes sp. N902-109]AGL15005.1 extradiol ring-cleavage dioxygenase class III protein subunit B [Actinoplanes sp. N902-109]